MKKIIQLSSIFAASLLVSTCALAEQAPKWDFVQASYVNLSGEDDDILNLSGFGISGAKLLNKNIFIAASYQNISDNMMLFDTKFKVNVTFLSAGIGYRHDLSTTTDIYGLVAFESVDSSLSFNGDKESDDDTGYSLSVGIRSMITDDFELGGGIIYSDLAEDTGFEVNAFYHFNANLSIGASYVIADDTDTLAASVRYSF